ncbi:unnamed protein product [Triticum turgidum subsp. durum]|uniref:Uncharacterized protein n=1 Tax=Triticum turgidum subsp. durum TaxID=4567 RepID=A0A9R0Q5D9_TRITD|nr:unnamed protein product [Triticum turgidum subsp. durum]
MAQGSDAAACRCSLPLLPLPPRRLLLVVLVAMLTVVLVAPPSARAAWVEDYPSGVPCGATIPVEQCDPGDAAANSACMDIKAAFGFPPLRGSAPEQSGNPVRERSESLHSRVSSRSRRSCRLKR